jgi:hypothetical protein
LLALKPFVFPALKLKTENWSEEYPPEPRDESSKETSSRRTKSNANGMLKDALAANSRALARIVARRLRVNARTPSFARMPVGKPRTAAPQSKLKVAA